MPVTLRSREIPKQEGSVKPFDDAGQRHHPNHSITISATANNSTVPSKNSSTTQSHHNATTCYRAGPWIRSYVEEADSRFDCGWSQFHAPETGVAVETVSAVQVVADQANHFAAAANRLGSQGPTVEMNMRTPRHRCVGASKRTPIAGT